MTQLSHLLLYGLFVFWRVIDLCRFLDEQQRHLQTAGVRVHVSAALALQGHVHLSASNSISGQPVMSILGVPDLHRVLLRILQHVLFEQALHCGAVLSLAHAFGRSGESESIPRRARCRVHLTVRIVLSSLPSIPFYDGCCARCSFV